MAEVFSCFVALIALQIWLWRALYALIFYFHFCLILIYALLVLSFPFFPCWPKTPPLGLLQEACGSESLPDVWAAQPLSKAQPSQPAKGNPFQPLVNVIICLFVVCQRAPKPCQARGTWSAAKMCYNFESLNVSSACVQSVLHWHFVSCTTMPFHPHSSCLSKITVPVHFLTLIILPLASTSVAMQGQTVFSW